MKIYDISMTVSPDMMTYKNSEQKRPVFTNVADFTSSSHYETQVSANLHTGTHIDAPLHMIENGATIESYDISRFMTECRVLDLTEVRGMIHKEDLLPLAIESEDFLLFKTRNSFEENFNPEFISLAEDGAAYLKEMGVRGAGIDALGIERGQANHMTHKILLENNIIIIEGLRLKEVPEGRYQLIALPIKLAEVEAAPVRAVLIEA